jgi:hypothetical protein
MNRPTVQDMEAEKVKTRILFYLADGSRLVYISRWVVTGIVIVIWLGIWWRGLG